MQLAKTSGRLTHFISFKSKPRLVVTRAMSSQINPKAQEVLDYWLGPGWESASPADTRSDRRQIWFGGGPAIDAEITNKFGEDCEALIRGDLDGLHKSGNVFDTLAGILIGDQFTRNVYRGSAKMYAADKRVLSWAKDLVVSTCESMVNTLYMEMKLKYSAINLKVFCFAPRCKKFHRPFFFF